MLQQQCSKVVRLSGRLDRIYSIDLVEAPSSVYEPAWLRLGEPFDATESERRTIRGSFESARSELDTMSTMPNNVMLHELSSAYDPVPRAASVLGWSSVCDIVAQFRQPT